VDPVVTGGMMASEEREQRKNDILGMMNKANARRAHPARDR
jgi:hypothetical protein